MTTGLNLVLLEGQDDLGVLKQLLLRQGFSDRGRRGEAHELADLSGRLLWLKAKGGYDTLRATLAQELKAPLARVAVVFDANSEPASRWQSLTDALERAGVRGVRGHPEEGGTVFALEEQPVFGLWMMPGNGQAGYLEDWLGTLVRADDQLWPLAKAR